MNRNKAGGSPGARSGKAKKILDAALKSFSEKGFSKTTISEIAGRAGVAETTIYEYFRNKEDILFSIPESFFADLNRSLDDHFLGVEGVENLFRKFIWHHLHFFQEHPQQSSLYILELWNRPRFMTTKAHSLWLQYRNRLEGIIEAGKAERMFDPKIPTSLCMSMVLGTFNHVLLSKVMLGKPLDLIVHAQPLFELFTRAMKPGEDLEQAIFENEGGKRGKILEAALLEFRKHGFRGATISRIAKRAGVTEPTIYEYFKNKEDLLYSIPEVAMQGFLKSLQDSLSHLDMPVNQLYNFILHQTRSVRDAPTYYSLLIMELRNDMGFYRSQGYQSLRRYSSRFLEIIKEGIDAGQFRADLDLPSVRDLYFGTFDDITLELLLRKEQHMIVERSEFIFDMVYRAIRKDPGENPGPG